MAAGFPWQGCLFQIDPASRAAIAERALVLQLDPAKDSVSWRCSHNTMVTFTRDQFIQFALAVSRHVEQIYHDSWAQKEAPQ